MPGSDNTGTADKYGDMGIYAIRTLYSLLLAAVLWIYATVDDLKEDSITAKGQRSNMQETITRHDRRIGELEDQVIEVERHQWQN